MRVAIRQETVPQIKLIHTNPQYMNPQQTHRPAGRVRRVTQPLTRQQLDQRGCANPQCAHGDHPVLFFSGACHPTAASSLFWSQTSQTITLRCARCALFVASVTLADGGAGDLLNARCHWYAPVEVSYDKHAGMLAVGCAKCDTTIGDFAVADG